MQVLPEQFCDKIWAGDLHYKEHECDFLAAYVAICYTHQICFSWRTSNFCRESSQTQPHKDIPDLSQSQSGLCLHSCRFCIIYCVYLCMTALKCPPGKEYKPCVNTCKTMTCQNRDYYEESICSSIREECVCKSGTILHRADSAFCVTEDQCGEILRNINVEIWDIVTSLLIIDFICELFQISVIIAPVCHLLFAYSSFITESVVICYFRKFSNHSDTSIKP